MHIALCDDERQQQELTASLIQKYKEERPHAEIRLSIFSSGDELLFYLAEHERYDLYLLDIIMPKTNGIQTGLALREQKDDGLIVYLTTSPDFAVDSYQIQAFHYLLKPITESQLFEILDRAYAQIERQNTSALTIKTAEGTLRLLPLSSILYAELIGRSVRYYLTSGETVNSVTFRGSFREEVSSLLESNAFTLCGSSFAVNLRHITTIRKTDIILSNDFSVPLSRNLYSSVKKKWMLYWLEKR